MKKNRRSIDIGDDEEDDSRDGDMQEMGQEKSGNSHGVIKDIEYLKNMNIDYSVPSSSKEKDLRACMGCKLILSDNQWAKIFKNGDTCINCKENYGITPYYNGSISLFMPNASWVAKWNGLEGKKPGIYAIGILKDGEYADDYEDDQDMEHVPAKKKKRANKA